ncbi:5,10-methenyltetrahydrofolate synthetase (5-formyltetrahydrofolate cyclo-ligase) isoform X3 [Siniperca chuatsi]|uniref:5,10-methenyltetrahydrofolate synthetase (5-formyltetrahydrofolate cyclo-ligase) isoform X3 n=1 Tax=Siniperca chuatsi TaxID=119488 RepID=UPI001CE1B1AD|nr:5,10-methenyltetrahydrofolate synthetase (5-formyltetrahydrofolate cyclo-ligase) isoform X3 [Siniperca chuatsi]
MAALRAAKRALRKEIKRRVAALSDEEKQRQSLIVSQKLFRHPKYVSCKRIAVFLSMDDEVRTEEIIKDVFKWGKSCFIPRYESSSSHMDMLKLDSLQDMETLPLTSWNIRQPAEDDNSREEALATEEASMEENSPDFVPSVFSYKWPSDRCVEKLERLERKR